MRSTATLLVVLALAAGVWGLRATTMSRHRPVPTDSSLELHVGAETRDPDDPVDALTRAHVSLCTAEAIPSSDVVAFAPATPAEPGEGAHAYTVRLRPGADAPDRDQLHGCLEDLRVRHLRLEVESMTYRDATTTLERDT